MGSEGGERHFPDLHPLTGTVYGDGLKALVIFLHGDVSRGGPADYMYEYGQKLANEHDLTAVAILRPGYWDTDGRSSAGSTNGRCDHYTAENNRLVRKTIENLVAESGISRVIAVGHSGGAAQLGVLIARSRGLIDVAILAACPCDIRKWREGKRRWPDSQSPSDFIDKVDPKVKVEALTGADDDNTLPELAKNYVKELSKRGIDAEFTPIPGGNHGFKTIAPEVMKTIKSHLGET